MAFALLRLSMSAGLGVEWHDPPPRFRSAAAQALRGPGAAPLWEMGAPEAGPFGPSDTFVGRWSSGEASGRAS